MSSKASWQSVTLKVLAVLGIIPAFSFVAMTLPNARFGPAALVYSAPAIVAIIANCFIIAEKKKWYLAANRIYIVASAGLAILSCFLAYGGVTNTDGVNASVLYAFSVLCFLGCIYSVLMTLLLRHEIR